MKRRVIITAVMSLIAVAVCLLDAIITTDTLSRIGDDGEEVRLIQEKLIEYGYLAEGEADGIFGTKTRNAVKEYQKANGLSVDGIVGKKTLKSLGIDDIQSQYENDRNVEMLARVISAEARSEPYLGQVAVGAVVLNRVKSAEFPNTIASVIYQKNAFTSVTDGQFDMKPTASSYRAAVDAINGMDPTGGCVYFYDPRYTTNKYMLSLEVEMTIGHHVFCE